MDRNERRAIDYGAGLCNEPEALMAVLPICARGGGFNESEIT